MLSFFWNVYDIFLMTTLDNLMDRIEFCPDNDFLPLFFPIEELARKDDLTLLFSAITSG